ncbi:hypothetical protein [Streptomyces sp. NPDC004528]
MWQFWAPRSRTSPDGTEERDLARVHVARRAGDADDEWELLTMLGLDV